MRQESSNDMQNIGHRRWWIAGALVGTYLGQALHLYRVGEPAGFIGSVLGAMLILLGYRLIRGGRSRPEGVG